MWQKLECVAIYTHDLDKSVEFYNSMGLAKEWEAVPDEAEPWRLIGMTFPGGASQLVLKNNPDRTFSETEVVVHDVRKVHESLAANEDVRWILAPTVNSLGGHVAVLQAPDGNTFVLVGP